MDSGIGRNINDSSAFESQFTIGHALALNFDTRQLGLSRKNQFVVRIENDDKVGLRNQPAKKRREPFGTAVAVAQRIHEHIVEVTIELYKIRSDQAGPDDEKIAGPAIGKKRREIGHRSQGATWGLAVRFGDRAAVLASSKHLGSPVKKNSPTHRDDEFPSESVDDSALSSTVWSHDRKQNSGRLRGSPKGAPKFACPVSDPAKRTVGTGNAPRLLRQAAKFRVNRALCTCVHDSGLDIRLKDFACNLFCFLASQGFDQLFNRSD